MFVLEEKDLKELDGIDLGRRYVSRSRNLVDELWEKGLAD